MALFVLPGCSAVRLQGTYRTNFALRGIWASSEAARALGKIAVTHMHTQALPALALLSTWWGHIASGAGSGGCCVEVMAAMLSILQNEHGWTAAQTLEGLAQSWPEVRSQLVEWTEGLLEREMSDWSTNSGPRFSSAGLPWPCVSGCTFSGTLSELIDHEKGCTKLRQEVNS